MILYQLSLMRFAVFLIALFIASNTYAQRLDIRFRNLTIRDGLSQSTITCIFQDSQGFMWFGTQYGLNRYDGYHIVVYQHNPKDTGSISNNHIYYIYEDRNQVLWVGTADGLNRFDRTKNSFIHYKNDPANANSISNNFVTCIYEDQQKDLWISTYGGGLNLFNRKDNVFIHFRSETGKANSLSSDLIKYLFEDKRGNFWVGTDGEGLNLFDRKNKTFGTYRNHFGNNRINCIQDDRDGNLWLGTEGGGLLLFDREQKSFQQFRHQEQNPASLANDEIATLFTDKRGNLWIGTINGGLDLFNPKSYTFFHYQNDPYDPSSLSQKTASALFEDNQGNLWVGTHRGGVNLYSPKAEKLKHYTKDFSPNSLSYKDVKSFYEDSKGNIWIGTDGGGLNLFDREKNIFRYYQYDPYDPKSIGSDAPLHIMEDSQRNIWIGTWGGGLNLFDPDTGTFTRFKTDANNKSSISSNNVWRIYEDRRGNLWIATNFGGLNLFDRKTKKFTRIIEDPTKQTQLYGDIILSISEDKSGKLWIGTADGGLNCYDLNTQQFSHYFYNGHKTPVQINTSVRVIFTDSKGRLWVGQKGLHLYQPESKTFTLYSDQPGLADEAIQGITEDENGNLWVSSPNGLYKFNPDTYTYQIITDGRLQGMEFGPNTCLKTKNGEMLFGGTNGFYIFHPDSIKNNSFIPPVYITDFQIFNKSVVIGGKESPIQNNISDTKEINLSYQQSVFSFEFSALNYASPEKNQYAYKMEGFDSGWNYVGTQRKATYTNLDPGKYTFRIKASNNDGVWNEEGNSINVLISPPFWLTWWFKTLIALMVMGSTFSFSLIRINRVKAQKLELEKQVKERTVQLTAANEELTYQKEELEIRSEQLKEAAAKQAKINKELDQFAYIVSHDLKAPLRGISNLSDWIAEDLGPDITPDIKNNIDSLKSRVSRMQNLIDGILSYTRAGKVKVNYEQVELDKLVREIITVLSIPERFEVIITKNLPVVTSNSTLLEQVFTNLISNAIKYHDKPQGTITIQYEEDAKFYQLSVTDDGPGIPQEYHEKIFGIFQTLQARDKKESTGVGLAIVKKIIEEQGGSIWVESPGEGSSFIFTLPKNPSM